MALDQLTDGDLDLLGVGENLALGGTGDLDT